MPCRRCRSIRISTARFLALVHLRTWSGDILDSAIRCVCSYSANSDDIGYRKPLRGPGTWVVRRYVGNDSYTVRNLTTSKGHPIFADDHEDANGGTILDFWQAQDAARVKQKPANRECRAVHRRGRDARLF